ncbi:hypothetical protein G7046_g6770 [Stylonectria norvegica]|nr:hypothetical protein G7046_g6770 [Stylonectria norvegica]
MPFPKVLVPLIYLLLFAAEYFESLKSLQVYWVDDLSWQRCPSLQLTILIQQHLCGISIDEYTRKRRRGLFVCQTCKGRIVVELVNIVSPPNDPESGHFTTIAALGNGSFLQEFETTIWKRCGLSQFPGLKGLRPSWAKLVAHIAKEMAPNIERQDGGMQYLQVFATGVWDLDESLAYNWWKTGNQKRALSRNTTQGNTTQDTPRAARLESNRCETVETTISSSNALNTIHRNMDATQATMTPLRINTVGKQPNPSIHGGYPIPGPQKTQNLIPTSLTAATTAPAHTLQTPPIEQSQGSGPHSGPENGVVDLDGLEAKLLDLMKQHNAVEESITRAIECEELKRRSEIELASVASEIQRAREAGGVDLDEMEKRRQSLGEQAQAALCAYHRSVAEVLKQKKEYTTQQDAVGIFLD